MQLSPAHTPILLAFPAQLSIDRVSGAGRLAGNGGDVQRAIVGRLERLPDFAKHPQPDARRVRAAPVAEYHVLVVRPIVQPVAGDGAASNRVPTLRSSRPLRVGGGRVYRVPKVACMIVARLSYRFLSQTIWFSVPIRVVSSFGQ